MDDLTPVKYALAVKALESIGRAFQPVRDWYDGDGRNADLAGMIAAAVADLQSDRADVLRLDAERARLAAEVARLGELEAFARGRGHSMTETLRIAAAALEEFLTIALCREERERIGRDALAVVRRALGTEA